MTKSSDEKIDYSKDGPDPAFRERIAMLIERVGGPAELAKRTGLSRSVIDKYKNGQSDPSRTRLVALAEAAGVSLVWLAGGEGDIELGLSLERNPEQGFAELPVMSVRASAGSGAVALEEQPSGFIKFDRSWLWNNYHLNPQKLFVLPASGESMEPTIRSGELLMVSRDEDQAKPGDGIYLIRLDGNILVKRVQLLPGEKALISSDNPNYKPFEIPLHDGTDFVILGKVVLVLRRM